MNILGPHSISAINVPLHQDLDLHPFQRVTAQIVTVTGTTALLSIDGYPVVAQLASADQETALFSQQTAHFVVTKRTNQEVAVNRIFPSFQTTP